MELELKPPKRKRRNGQKPTSPYPVPIESHTGIPAHLTIWRTYSGYFNGDGVEVESPSDMSGLYDMGFFGKGLLSRGCPLPARRNQFPEVIRERQWSRRYQWATKLENPFNEDRVICETGRSEEKSSPISEQTKMDVQIEEVGITCEEYKDKSEEKSHESDKEKELCERSEDEIEKEPCKRGDGDVRKEPCKKNIVEGTEQSCAQNEPCEVQILSSKNGKNDCQRSNIEVVDVISSDEDGVSNVCSDQNKSHHGGGRSTERTGAIRAAVPSMKIDREVIVLADADSEDEDYLSKLKPRLERDVNQIEVLVLSMEEALFLSYGLGCLNVLNITKERTLDIVELWKLSQECDSRFVERYVAYHYYRSRGWVVKSGIKFGGDFLLYKEGPGTYHASFIVVVEVVFKNSDKSAGNTKREMNWTSLMGLNRLAESSGKEVLLCQVVWPVDCPHKNLPTPNVIKRFTVLEFIIRRWQSTVARIDHSDPDAMQG